MNKLVKSNIVVDFDGTLIAEDLGDTFGRWLVLHGLSSTWWGLSGLPLGVLNTTCRRLFNIPFCNRLFIGLPDNVLEQLASTYVRDFASKFTLNFALIDWLASVQHKKVLLTACPEFLVRAFLDYTGIEIFDEIRGQRRGRLGWIMNPTPFGRHKIKFLTYPIFCAIADSHSDRFVLKKSRNSVVIGENIRMRRMAQHEGWITCGFGQPIPSLQFPETRAALT
jgi:phosphoserine phosphatase